MHKIYQWLLEGEAWIQYRTRIDLLGQKQDDAEVRQAHQTMLEEPRIKILIKELSDWPGMVINNHKKADLSIHTLSFLAELGLTRDDPGIAAIIDQIFSHRSQYGPFQVLLNIPKVFGGSGEDSLAWTLCDTPLILFALLKFGYQEDERVKQAAKYLQDLVRENGWHCTASPELGKFHGPGNKNDPCPYANLIMLKAFAQDNTLRDSDACKMGAEAQLTLWQKRREIHPYLFHMGTDFCKLKAPFIWYDLLHVLDVLSQFSWVKGDPRIQDMLAVLKSKANAEGRFTPESVWMAWKTWDFGQKKEPSRWITFLCYRILQRLES